MKKFFAVVLVLFIIGLVCIYIFIPAEIKISSISVMKANERAVYRSLINENEWEKWWPSTNNDPAQKRVNPLILNDHKYVIGTKPAQAIELIITGATTSNSSMMRLLPLSTDSMAIEWSTTATTTTTFNPFTKLDTYVEAQSIKFEMRQILSHLKSFAELGKNLYHIDIKKTTVTDTLLMVKKNIQKERPTINNIYSYISDISKYISEQAATETNHPMLHSSYKNDLKIYEVMVAIPVNKRLAGNISIIPKRMVAGNILYADIQGGEATIEEAIRQMENYVTDHQKISPALTYQLLVTDRTKETDTTKWITRLYYPIL